MVAPFNAPNKFKVEVWEVQFQEKLPKVWENPPLADDADVYPIILQFEAAFQVAAGIVPPTVVCVWL